MAEDPKQCGYVEIAHVDYPSVAESDVKNVKARCEEGTHEIDEYPCDPNFAASAGGKVTTAPEDKDADEGY